MLLGTILGPGIYSRPIDKYYRDAPVAAQYVVFLAARARICLSGRCGWGPICQRARSHLRLALRWRSSLILWIRSVEWCQPYRITACIPPCITTEASMCFMESWIGARQRCCWGLQQSFCCLLWPALPGATSPSMPGPGNAIVSLMRNKKKRRSQERLFFYSSPGATLTGPIKAWPSSRTIRVTAPKSRGGHSSSERQSLPCQASIII